jgi:hypothetical protein
MSRSPLFSIAVSSELPEAETQTLLEALRAELDIQEPAHRTLPPEWITFVAIMKDIGIVAGAGAAVLRLVNEINTWRHNARRRGVEPKAQLYRPNQPPLDLATATDEEVRRWLSQE